MPHSTKLDPEQIARELRERIGEITFDTDPATVGVITAVGDGVISCSGLSEAKLGELVILPNGIVGLVLNLRENEVNVVVLGDFEHLREGDEVKASGKLFTVRGSYQVLGRIVDPLMRPVDGLGTVTTSDDDKLMPVERIAPGVIDRQDVRTPLYTGIKLIDSLIPVGRGQRELIIGDRGIGKTAIAVDAIINQARINKQLGESEKRVLCIYVAIGQKQSKIAQTMVQLTRTEALADTVIVSAPASVSASMQYLAPFAATALGEYFMERGEDVLIVYDDLSKHAWAYRQLSLLLRRPSGREAYPGDIFYLHSRLLERSARMSEEMGGGSMTAFPIIETQAGDISAYIPTNVISITDGQIYLDPDIFYSGLRPAVSVGLSVSRVGGDAQIKAMKQVAGSMKLDLAQYRELAAFAQFGADLDESTQRRLARGKAQTRLLKQPQYSPLPMEEEVAVLWLGMRGHIDGIEEDDVSEFERSFLNKLNNNKKKPLENIRKKQVLDEETERILEETAGEVRSQFE